MIIRSNNLPKVLKSICSYNESIIYDPLRFTAFIKDVYIGKDEIANDFIIAIQLLNSIIPVHSLRQSSIPEISLSGVNCAKRSFVQRVLLNIVYKKEDRYTSQQLNELIAEAYNKEYSKKTHLYSEKKSSHIAFFKVSPYCEIEYGRIIILSWECINPYKVSLYNGHEYMDVSGFDSISISAMFEKYMLLLYDRDGKVVDEKEISITFRKHSFCVICGSLYRESDTYCWHCGIKL